MERENTVHATKLEEWGGGGDEGRKKKSFPFNGLKCALNRGDGRLASQGGGEEYSHLLL